jgi:hypothetical protein
VDNENLTRCLETYHAAGLGGVEITCIYGVQDQQQRHIPYLSDQWLDVVGHAIREANRLGMGVDLPPGSGWRIGGPSVAPEDGNADFRLQSESVAGGSSYEKLLSTPRPHAIVAYSTTGEIVELIERIGPDGNLTWRAPAGDGDWTVYTLTMRLTGERVKRPGPGGEGRNINPYTRRPVTRFLDYFGERIDQLPPGGLRATFHDSFEYEGNWSDDFLDQFRQRRGYALEHHLPALDGRGNQDEVARVKSDYRETISDLVLSELIEPWVAWAHARGQLARNQAHGSPGNWLDLYAAADIPETESFGRLEGGDGHPLMFKFASSAAHVAGRQLVSSESATWLDEHFTETLAKVKQILDRQFLAGVNHTIYHGTAYSPADAQWPGWLFYASSQLNPQNPIWRDFPVLNQYVERCQSWLQAGAPDNDILVYWPIHDFWHNPRGLREPIRVHNVDRWFRGTPLGEAAQWLDEEGYAFDYVSDRLLATCNSDGERIVAPGASYSIVLVPHTKHMPAATLQKLRELAEAGGTVVFWNELPSSPPGLEYEQKQRVFDDARSAIVSALGSANVNTTVAAALGEGRIIVAQSLDDALASAGVRPESFRKDSDIQFIRRRLPDSVCYFLCNQGETAFNDWVTLRNGFRSAAVLDPLDGRLGVAEVKDGRQVRLQLEPGQTKFVCAFDTETTGNTWQYISPAGDPITVKGNWQVEFIAGGPTIPAGLAVNRLASWTTFAPPETESFAGTAAYTINFDRPANQSDEFLLDLGDVRESARVMLNGQEVATLITPPFRVRIGSLRETGNELRVEVTNVAANRIRDLDRRGARWRIFQDINVVNINYRPFDASNWPVRDAGLLGPVSLQPLR